MATGEFKDKEKAKKAGQKSSRKGIKNFATVFKEKLAKSAGSISESYRKAFALRAKLMNKMFDGEELTASEQKMLDTVNKMCNEAITKVIPTQTENKNENVNIHKNKFFIAPAFDDSLDAAEEVFEKSKN